MGQTTFHSTGDRRISEPSTVSIHCLWTTTPVPLQEKGEYLNTPWKINMEPKYHQLKSQTIIFRFYANLPGCIQYFLPLQSYLALQNIIIHSSTAGLRDLAEWLRKHSEVLRQLVNQLGASGEVKAQLGRAAPEGYIHGDETRGSVPLGRGKIFIRCFDPPIWSP